ncbi:acetate/propionate family kinase [Streptomyces sp. WAC00263]|uniref:acetate/propionate family kinase n=1 Tax=Streptomyces sp. WAC00263 TaxID=1917422 RepID=UPI0015EEE284|nr:acetate/propionate family kinase [Streptomyces sp. WAC00263]KAF5990659.1 acetate kinase [Streptomyces sp. WAC00263]
MRVLVVNAGSSSLKLRLLDGRDTVLESADLAAGPDGFDISRLTEVLLGWGRPDVVGHRVVHGGTAFTGPARIDDAVRERLRDLTDLAPLHQPKSLAALDAVTTQLPEVAAVACFDTAFHATIPASAATYAIPLEWRQRYAIRRYGFHGLSHAYCSRRAAELLGRRVEGLRVVTCHLGAGASLAAVVDGRSVDTTMGFTPLEGLVMATRSGTVDPGLLLWLEEHEHLAPHEVATALEQRSGLTALAGTGDMREVEAAAAHGDPAAVLALDVYTHRLVGGIAAMSAASAGVDVLVFTGGVGEHSATVRRRAVERLGFLSAAVDGRRNDSVHDDSDITAAGAAVRTLVITAREDLQIARETRRLLQEESQ